MLTMVTPSRDSLTSPRRSPRKSDPSSRPISSVAVRYCWPGAQSGPGAGSWPTRSRQRRGRWRSARGRLPTCTGAAGSGGRESWGAREDHEPVCMLAVGIAAVAAHQSSRRSKSNGFFRKAGPPSRRPHWLERRQDHHRDGRELGIRCWRRRNSQPSITGIIRSSRMRSG